MRNELKLVRIGTDPDAKRVYLYNRNYINVDRFNDILDSWYYMCYDVKKYDMHRGNQHIFIWYVK